MAQRGCTQISANNQTDVGGPVPRPDVNDRPKRTGRDRALVQPGRPLRRPAWNSKRHHLRCRRAVGDPGLGEAGPVLHRAGPAVGGPDRSPIRTARAGTAATPAGPTGPVADGDGTVID